ncbi:MAG: RluA family pseudouridine synthase [Actinomycetia bacterium]|nr:RluA family pseudouridine synthase [Actinomycetes bacterium]
MPVPGGAERATGQPLTAPRRYELVVEELSEPVRLDIYLALVPAVGSRAGAERIIASGGIHVDGRRRPKSYRLGGGERLELTLRPPEPPVLVPEEMDIACRYEDEHLLVVDKPAGLVVHPGAGRREGTLVHGLLGHGIAGGHEGDRPGIVHRLDRDTSGLLVVARSAEAHRRLSGIVERRELVRIYTALVRAKPRSWRGTIEAPIGRDRRDSSRQSLDTDTPREAITHFEVVELFEEHALLDVRLETGRQHQIRLHLAEIGLPVSGDPTYGVSGDLGLSRQFLHAAMLSFAHPFTHAQVEVVSPLPEELSSVLPALRQQAKRTVTDRPSEQQRTVG